MGDALAPSKDNDALFVRSAVTVRERHTALIASSTLSGVIGKR
jgi:hypothetical protein